MSDNTYTKPLLPELYHVPRATKEWLPGKLIPVGTGLVASTNIASLHRDDLSDAEWYRWCGDTPSATTLDQSYLDWWYTNYGQVNK